jgi:hypothetical protein
MWGARLVGHFVYRIGEHTSAVEHTSKLGFTIQITVVVVVVVVVVGELYGLGMHLAYVVYYS